MPGETSGEVIPLRRRPLRSTINGSPFSEQSFKTYQVLWMMILGPPLREDLRSGSSRAKYSYTAKGEGA
ncbi:hypothetical protein V512_013360 [Mesotoga sp. Brook.08.105.5.1]|nr:hypothetical protein V512_013360 [Mesotoga sp. Brook.08.105.5.1]